MQAFLICCTFDEAGAEDFAANLKCQKTIKQSSKRRQIQRWITSSI
jgi:hypothetical protein